VVSPLGDADLRIGESISFFDSNILNVTYTRQFIGELVLPLAVDEQMEDEEGGEEEEEEVDEEHGYDACHSNPVTP